MQILSAAHQRPRGGAPPTDERALLLCPAHVWLEASEQWAKCTVRCSMTCAKKELCLQCLPTERGAGHASPLLFASIRRKNLCCIQTLNHAWHNREFVLKIVSATSSFHVRHNLTLMYLAVDSLATQQRLRHRLLQIMHTHDPLRKPGPFARDDGALALCRAAFSGDFEQVRALLDSGQVDARDANEAGESAVMRATRNALATLESDDFNRALQIVDYLIERGADPYVSNSTSEESALDLVLRAKQARSKNAELDLIEARLRRHRLVYDGNGGISSGLPKEEPSAGTSRWLENMAHLRASCLGKLRDTPAARHVGAYHLISEHQTRMIERARTNFVDAMNSQGHGAIANCTVDHHGAQWRNQDSAAAHHRNNQLGGYDHSHIFGPLEEKTCDGVDRPPPCNSTFARTQQHQPHHIDPSKRRQDEKIRVRRALPSGKTRRSLHADLSPPISRPRTSPSISGSCGKVNATCGKVARPQTATAALALRASQDTGRCGAHFSYQPRWSERRTSVCRQFSGTGKFDRRSDVCGDSYDEHVTVRAVKQWKDHQRATCRSSIIGKVHAGLFLPAHKRTVPRRKSLSGKHQTCLDSRNTSRNVPRCRSVLFEGPLVASRLQRLYPRDNSQYRPSNLRSGRIRSGCYD